MQITERTELRGCTDKMVTVRQVGQGEALKRVTIKPRSERKSQGLRTSINKKNSSISCWGRGSVKGTEGGGSVWGVNE